MVSTPPRRLNLSSDKWNKLLEMNGSVNLSSELKWYVAQLKPGGYEAARRNLVRQGLTVFMPLQVTNTKRRGISVVRNAPMFAGYLFVEQLSETDNSVWRKINNTLGVSRLVTAQNDRPSTLPVGFVQALANRCDENGVYRLIADFMPGDQVDILAGPFAGLSADIEKMTAAGRVAVLLEILGRAVRTEVSQEFLDFAPKSLRKKVA